jgi:hypothetical protein
MREDNKDNGGLRGMPHKGKHSRCPNCFNRLAVGGQWKYCPRCGYSSKPKKDRNDYTKPRKILPEKRFESDIVSRIRRWGAKAIHIRRTKWF